MHERVTETTANGRNVTVGTEITWRASEGRRRGRFMYATPEWWTVAQIDRKSKKSGNIRSFHPDAVITVHRKAKARDCN